MARDWRMAPASFRGISFYVDQESLPQGRRKVTHEYPGSESWDVEDMGASAGRFSVTCYFSSETSDTDCGAFEEALNQPDAGTLILPFFGALQVQSEKWSPAWSKDRLNYVGLEVSFIEDNPASAPAPVGLGARIMASQGAALGATLGAVITSLFSGI